MRRALPLACLALLVPGVSRATTILRLETLDTLVAESRRALLGEVVDVRYGYDEHGLHSTRVTLRVDDPIYGRLPPRGRDLEIKLYGAPVPMPDGTRLFVDGTPRYRVGDRYLLLLLDDSPWGFAGTVGLYQGAFRVSRGADGRDMAESLGGNRAALGERGLGAWLSPADVEPHDLPLLDGATAAVPYTLLRQAIERAKGADAP